MGAGQMAHEFRITKPAIGHDYGGGSATPRRRNAATHPSTCPAPSAVCPGTAPRAGGGQAAGWQSPRAPRVCHHQSHDQEHPIDAGEDPVFLPTPPPGAYQTQLFAILLNTESSPTQVHCQRLRVAALAPAA